MKLNSLKTLPLLASLLLGSCNTQDDWYNSGFMGGNANGDTDGGTSGALMDFNELSTFTIETNTAAMSEQESIPMDESNYYYNDYVENNFTLCNTTSIVFNNTNDAKVTGVAEGDTVTVNKGTVEVHAHGKGLNIEVCGSTSDGSLKIYSDKKFRLELRDASITNLDGSALNIQDGKCFLVLSGTNSLSDAADAPYSHPEDKDMKAVLFAEDNLRISGSGSLSINAVNKVGKSGISVDDDIFIRPNTNIRISAGSSAGNGIKSNSNITIKGGVLNIETSAAGSKGLSADGNMQIDGGRITIITSGGVDASDSSNPSGCSAIKCDSTLLVNGGELRLKSTGQGGKGISVDEQINICGGDLYVLTEGSKYGSSNSGMGGFGGWGGGSSSSNSVSPKGIRCDKDIHISGGNVYIRTLGSNAEGIESKTTLTFSGGNTAALAYDDGFNAKTINISGGRALAISSGNCDGMDSNGTITATGGVLIGVSSTQGSEDGIDCESTFTISNATVVGLCSGGFGVGKVSGKYIYTKVSGTLGDYVSLCNGSTPLVTFQLPRTYNSGNLFMSAPSLQSGNYTLRTGVTPGSGSLWMNYLEGCESVSGGSSTSVSCK